MILAELHGKIPSKLDNMEDILTSNIFSFFKYSDRSYLRKYLKQLGIEITYNEALDADFLFWPQYTDGTEPDLIIICGKYYILFEAKLFSDFSPKTKNSESQINRETKMGQLAAKSLKKEFIFIAITAEYFKLNEKYSQYEDANFQFIWTNWQMVASFLLFCLNENSIKENQAFIVDLLNLLTKKRLRSFISLNKLNLKGILKKTKYIFYNTETSNFKGEFSGYNTTLNGFNEIGHFKTTFQRIFFNLPANYVINNTQHIFYNREKRNDRNHISNK